MHIAGKLRMLRAVRHIVLADMCRQLSLAGGAPSTAPQRGPVSTTQ